MKQGGIYQVKGPFDSGVNVLSKLYSAEGISGAVKIRFGVSLDEKDWLPWGEKDQTFSFTVTGPNLNSTIKMGRSHIYEADDGIFVESIVFNQAAPESTIVNFIVCE